METILLKILEVQNEILAELRLLRQAVTSGQSVEAAPSACAPAPADAPLPETSPEPARAPAAHPASGGMLTLDDLADLGGQFLEGSQLSRARVKPVDASDLSNSILDEIKAKNRAKRGAFAEFDKFGRDR